MSANYLKKRIVSTRMNGRNSTSYTFYGLVFKEVLVFEITKTKTPKFTVKVTRPSYFVRVPCYFEALW